MKISFIFRASSLVVGFELPKLAARVQISAGAFLPKNIILTT